MMKAAVLHGKGKIRYDDWPDPVVKKGTILVGVHACGICGSDVPRIWGDEAHSYPIILGHEFAGEVLELGEGVTEYRVGDRVAGVPLLPCMRCESCQQGHYSHCKHYSFIGSREQGALADKIVIPVTNAVKLPQGVSYECGALFEPATVALHGILNAKFQGGSKVAILGGGNIGILAMQWVKALGASEVSVFDIQQERLDLATRLGANRTVNLCQTSENEWMEYLDQYDYVYETAGQFDTIRRALDLAGYCGKVIYIGTPHRDGDFSWKQWEKINRKELRLCGTWMSYSAPFPGKEWIMTAEYFGKALLKIDDGMIFAKYSLSEIEQAADLFQHPNLVKGKVIITN